MADEGEGETVGGRGHNEDSWMRAGRGQSARLLASLRLLSAGTSSPGEKPIASRSVRAGPKLSKGLSTTTRARRRLRSTGTCDGRCPPHAARSTRLKWLGSSGRRQRLLAGGDVDLAAAHLLPAERNSNLLESLPVLAEVGARLLNRHSTHGGSEGGDWQREGWWGRDAPAAQRGTAPACRSA